MRMHPVHHSGGRFLYARASAHLYTTIPSVQLCELEGIVTEGAEAGRGLQVQ